MTITDLEKSSLRCFWQTQWPKPKASSMPSDVSPNGTPFQRSDYNVCCCCCCCPTLFDVVVIYYLPDLIGCKPVMFWMVVRHGTQYPSSHDVFRMKDRLPKLRKTILQNKKERRGCMTSIIDIITTHYLVVSVIWYRNTLPAGRWWSQQQWQYSDRWWFRWKTNGNWPWRIAGVSTSLSWPFRRLFR